MSNRRLRRRFWLEAFLGLLAALLAAMTLLWHDWAEVLFGIDPDQGNGSFEFLVTIGAVALFAAFALAARFEWRRVSATS